MNRGCMVQLMTAGMLCSLLLLSPSEARADAVERAFRGKVVITEKQPPAKFPSQAAFMRFLRTNAKKHLWPDKNNKKQWKFEFMAFFRAPLDDLQVTIKFFDITEIKKFIAADTYYISSRGQRTFASNMVLPDSRFAVNRKYQMQVLDARNVLLASTDFWLRGEKEHYSGKVNFTDEETRIKD